MGNTKPLLPSFVLNTGRTPCENTLRSRFNTINMEITHPTLAQKQSVRLPSSPFLNTLNQRTSLEKQQDSTTRANQSIKDDRPPTRNPQPEPEHKQRLRHYHSHIMPTYRVISPFSDEYVHIFRAAQRGNELSDNELRGMIADTIHRRHPDLALEYQAEVERYGSPYNNTSLEEPEPAMMVDSEETDDSDDESIIEHFDPVASFRALEDRSRTLVDEAQELEEEEGRADVDDYEVRRARRRAAEAAPAEAEDAQPHAVFHAEALYNNTGLLYSEVADRSMRALDEHYRTLDPLLQVLRFSMREYEQEDPAGYQAFHNHILNAYIVSEADVRIYDILRWYTKIPLNVKLPLNDLSRYYHQEAVLRTDLRRAEGRLVGNPLLDDEQYAAEFGIDRSFGFNRTHADDNVNGPTAYLPRFSGLRQIKHLQASFEVRKVRLEHADMSERYPMKLNFRSVDNTVDKSLQTTRTFVEENGVDGAATLTADDRSLLEDVLAGMKAYQEAIAQRIQNIRDAREIVDGLEEHRDAMDARQAAGNGFTAGVFIAEMRSLQDQLATAKQAHLDSVNTVI